MLNVTWSGIMSGRTCITSMHISLCGQETKGYELISKTTLTYSTEAAARDQNTLGWGISLLSESMRVRVGDKMTFSRAIIALIDCYSASAGPEMKQAGHL